MKRFKFRKIVSLAIATTMLLTAGISSFATDSQSAPQQIIVTSQECREIFKIAGFSDNEINELVKIQNNYSKYFSEKSGKTIIDTNKLKKDGFSTKVINYIHKLPKSESAKTNTAPINNSTSTNNTQLSGEFNAATINPNWYTSTGGVWYFKSNNGTANPYMHYTRITYITYNQLALIAASNAKSGDLLTIRNLLRDQGIAKATAWVATKYGSKLAAKWVPYLGQGLAIYDMYTALASYVNNVIILDAIKKNSGIKTSEGWSNVIYSGPWGMNIMRQNWTAIENWNAPAVYNPTGLLGSFIPTK